LDESALRLRQSAGHIVQHRWHIDASNQILAHLAQIPDASEIAMIGIAVADDDVDKRATAVWAGAS
jgi:hypothetical protein